MKLINVDFVKANERLYGLGCRPVHQIKLYDAPFKKRNQQRAFLRAVIIVDEAKKRFN